MLVDDKYMDQTANTKGTDAKREKDASKVSQSVIKKLMHH